MAHISIYVGAQVHLSVPVTGFRLAGNAQVSSYNPVLEWQTEEISWTATPAQVNQAIQDAAIAAAVAAGLTIGGGDTKTITGGAVG